MTGPPPTSAPPPGAPTPAAGRPGAVAAVLTVAAPGMGHVFLADDERRTKAFLLLGATVAAMVLSCFFSFPAAVVVYLVAVTSGLWDLRGDLRADPAGDHPWRLVLGGGVLLALSLLFPWYRDTPEGLEQTISGREVLERIDVVLVAVGVGAAVLGALRRAPLAVVAIAAGAGALALVTFRMAVTPDGVHLEVERSFGILLAYAASVLVLGGALAAQRASGVRHRT